MTPEQARRAAETLEDVFTPDGDAGVIERLGAVPSRGGKALQCAYVTGERNHKWIPIADLTAREDLP